MDGLTKVILAIIGVLILINFFIGFTLLMLFILLLFITVVVTFTLIIWIPRLFNTVNNLADYQPLIQNRSSLDGDCLYYNFNQSCTFGENFEQKVNNTFFANLGIAFSLYLTLTYIIYAVPTSLYDFSAISSVKILFWDYTVPTYLSNISTSGIAFSVTFFMIPPILLSYRILANPTRLWFHKNNNAVGEIEHNQIKFFKDQVISFYFSFIASTVIVFYISILYLATKFGNSVDIRLILPFSTTMDLLTYVLMFLLEIVAIYTISYFEEKYFEKFKPIDQAEVWKPSYLIPKKYRKFL